MATYPLTPNRITRAMPEYKTTTIKFERGYEQRSPDHDEPIITFQLQHQMLAVATELQTLINFFKARKGSYEKFYFVNHIDNVTYECRFSKDSLEIEYINAFFASVNVELKTCL